MNTELENLSHPNYLFYSKITSLRSITNYIAESVYLLAETFVCAHLIYIQGIDKASQINVGMYGSNVEGTALYAY